MYRNLRVRTAIVRLKKGSLSSPISEASTFREAPMLAAICTPSRWSVLQAPVGAVEQESVSNKIS
jgi:hypothetical protein